jgi:hypothetical protein
MLPKAPVRSLVRSFFRPLPGVDGGDFLSRGALRLRLAVFSLAGFGSISSSCRIWSIWSIGSATEESLDPSGVASSAVFLRTVVTIGPAVPVIFLYEITPEIIADSPSQFKELVICQFIESAE